MVAGLSGLRLRRERLHPPFGLLPKCSTGNWDLVKCVSGTDTRSLDVFTQSQARYPLCGTQAERNRSTLPFPIRDVNPKAAVRRRSWIPLAVLMSLVYVALLSPSLKQRCPLNLIGGVGPRTQHRKAARF